MNRRLLVSLVTAGVAAASGVASANSQYWRDNGLLLEVSADPRDGSDFVQTTPTRAGSLDLVALNDTVRVRGMTVHFSDGRLFSTSLGAIRAGEHTAVDLPAGCGAITSVELDYGRQIVDRTPARLQIVPRAERVARPTWPSRGYDQPTYGYSEPAAGTWQPSYRTQAPISSARAYVVRPSAQARVSGRIRLSF